MSGARKDGSRSFYFFDIDDNLLLLATKDYLWNAETGEEKIVSSGEFAACQSELGRPGPWQAWNVRAETFRDSRDAPDTLPREQTFIKDLIAALDGDNEWRGPSWPLLEHAAINDRAIAVITARAHGRSTIEEGLKLLAERKLIVKVPPILGIYTVNNREVREEIGATDPAMTVPSAKKLAIKHAVKTALERYGGDLPHRFGLSDDDPANVVLAISAMRDCKDIYPDKRFFVINTHRIEFVKLEVFIISDPVTAVREDIPVL